MNKLQKESILHYRRMQKWVKTQDLNDKPDKIKMKDEINEIWYGKNCPYCEIYWNGKYYCTDCKLLSITGFRSEYCCGGLWHEMNDSATWGEWLERSEKVVEYIKENV